MQDLLDKIHTLNKHFRRDEKSEKERFLERILKLNEEVGELCEAALCEVDTNQRKKDKATNFDSELADVIICALMLSTQRNNDIEKTLHKTLGINLRRHNV